MIDIIKTKLQSAFSPIQLEVIDDSEKHRGHPGAASGAGHYTIIIQSDYFKNKTRIEAHREIYKILADDIPDKIHALKIKVLI